MPTISEQLNEIIVQKNALANNLATMGVEAATTETFNTLVPKVLQLSNEAVIDKPLYSFGVLSDVHIKHTDYGIDETHSQDDYRKALQYLDRSGINLVCIPGDVVANNHKKNGTVLATTAENEYIDELALFKAMNETYFPNGDVYTSTGNHDATTLGAYKAIITDGYITEQTGETPSQGMAQTVTDATSEWHGETAETIWNYYTGNTSNGKNLNFVIERGQDVFIFHSMYYWDYANYCRDDDVKGEDSWLSTTLETYKNQRVFLFFHLPLADTFDVSPSSGMVYTDNPAANSCNSHFYWLVKKYPNVIWFSGHTHYTLSYEANVEYDNPNIFQWDGSMVMIHCASCSYTRLVGNPYINNDEGSEGYVVDVYNDRVVIKSVDFANDALISVAQYIIGSN